MKRFSLLLPALLLLAPSAAPLSPGGARGEETAPAAPREAERRPEEKEEEEDEEKDPDFKVLPDPEGRAYFPKGKASYYTKYLRHMREPSVMAELPPGATFVLRFTLLPSFADNIVVRVYDENGVIKGRAARQKKSPEYAPMELTVDRTFQADRDLWARVRKSAAGKEFWKPLSDLERGLAGFDGVRWVLEWRDARHYHMVELWNPDDERDPDETLREQGFDPALIRDFKPYADLGRLLLKLADIKTDSVTE